jgi:glycosyltransferase involved in cell wall biosynthesis
MRILHVEASTGWGGQEIRILEEAKAMRARGHFVFFAIMRGGRLAARARDAGFQVYEMSFFYMGWGWTLCKLLWIFRKHCIEILNTHSSLDAWIGGIAARIAGKKIVRTRHLSTPVRPGWNSRTLYKTLADFVVTTCEAIIEPLAQQSGKPRHLFQSIATGVDPDKILNDLEKTRAFRRELGGEGTFIVGTACFMRSWKGIEEFLQAADLLRDRKDLSWVIIGGGHLDRYRALAKEMQLEGIVYFTGHLENPFPALAALDAFALLSTKNEGVSQAILQAAFLKKPLIATPTGGLREVCLDQKTGILVMPYCSREVADAVIQLKENANLREKMGSEAHLLVSERFTFKQTIDGMERAYQICCETKNISRRIT